jgi:hypothetical protein
MPTGIVGAEKGNLFDTAGSITKEMRLYFLFIKTE